MGQVEIVAEPLLLTHTYLSCNDLFSWQNYNWHAILSLVRLCSSQTNRIHQALQSFESEWISVFARNFNFLFELLHLILPSVQTDPEPVDQAPELHKVVLDRSPRYYPPSHRVQTQRCPGTLCPMILN